MKIKKILIPLLAFTGLFSIVSCANENTPETGGGVSQTEAKVEGKTYYCSPSGNASNDGLSKDTPTTFDSMVYKVSKGDTIILLDGTYNYSSPIQFNKVTYPTSTGTAVNPVTIKAENPGKVVLDFGGMDFSSSNRGLTINTDYYYVYGLEVCNAGDNGMYIGGSYNTIENCVFHDNSDTGLQLGRADGSYVNLADWPCNNLIKNCTSYNNYDKPTGGENADGFAAKLTVGYGNVFDGCIAYRNSDDGWDLFAKQDSGNIGSVILYNCVSFENGYLMEPDRVARVDEDGKTVKDENGNTVYDEVYTTTLGDGIGFKLGGSIMKGDVIMNNCLAFNNRLHGVGDNSNPGVIQVYNTTTYNNSALINANGEVDSSISATDSDDKSGNFNLARTENSYNAYGGLLSYVSNNSCQPDEYRGSAANSLFYTGKANGVATYRTISGNIDASSYSDTKKGEAYAAGLSDSDFLSVQVPTGTNDPNIHGEYRNEDGSINMGDILVLKPDKATELGNGSQVGAVLNKTSWDAYEHFDLTSGITENMTVDEAKIYGAANALTINCNANTVYQDFLLPLTVNGVDISWKSSDYTHAMVGDEVSESNSYTKEINISITRDKEQDVDVTLTATLTYEGYSITKDYVITVKKDEPEVGTAYLSVDNPKLILSQYDRFVEPKVYVTNDASYSGQLLLEGIDYHIEKDVLYSENKNSDTYPVSDVYTTKTGIYEITYRAVSNNNENIYASTVYTVYVINPNAQIDFFGEPTITVNRDGILLSGELDNVRSTVYALVSTNKSVTRNTLLSEGIKITVDEDVLNYQLEADNSDSYYVHLLAENSGENKSYASITTINVEKVEISTTAEFVEMVTNPTSSTMIYSLTQDLDFSEVTDFKPSAKTKFAGLFNGNGHTISNLVSNGVSIFGTLDGGTIMNVKFNEIDINAGVSGERVGLISEMYGGYVHHVEINNINIYGGRRIGGIVGQVHNGVSNFTEITIVNDSEHTISCKPYSQSGQDIGGLMGLVQNDSSNLNPTTINVEEVYVKTDISLEDARYVGGIIGRLDDRASNTSANIKHAIYVGRMHCDNYAGGILSFTTGAGQITIDSCAVSITTYKQGNRLVICEKNNSSIVGRFAINSGTGFTNVTNCYGTLGCYNYDAENLSGYIVNTIGSIVVTHNETMAEWLPNNIGLDLENVWEIVTIEGATGTNNAVLKLK